MFGNVFSSCAVLVAGLTCLGTMAAFAGDGREGPLRMNGAALDAALHQMNVHLQRRYDADDALANLDHDAFDDVADLAFAPDTVILMRPGSDLGAFGPMVKGDATLNVHMDAFEDERHLRGDDMFHRVSSMPPDTMPPLTAVSGIFNRRSIGGPVLNDPSLDARMRELRRNMRDFETRESRIGATSGPVTGKSFERYGSSLMLVN